MVKPLLDFCCYLVTKSCPAFCDPMGSQGVACKAPLSMGFSSKNTEVGCHFLLQGIFLTQGWNLGLLHGRRILYQLSYQGSHWFFLIESRLAF